MNLEERETYAKKFINDIRHEHGERRLAKLKRGIPMAPKMCVMATSLPCRRAQRLDDEKTVLFDTHSFTDPEISQFMWDFDRGKYPHLELPKTPIKMRKPGDRKATVIS